MSSFPHLLDFSDQDWLSELARHFEEIGIVRNGIIEDTIAKLRMAGVKEHQLRSNFAEDVLKRADISVGARKAILIRYQSPGSILEPHSHRSVGKNILLDDAAFSPQQFPSEQDWIASLERHLEELGFGRSGVAADAVGRLQRGGVREEELRGEGAERVLRELGVPIGARRAILTRYHLGPGGDGKGPNGLGDEHGGFLRGPAASFGVDSLMSVRGGATQVCAGPTQRNLRPGGGSLSHRTREGEGPR